jgi:glycosyltransferase involved in cell wall biosynthesis
MVKLSVILPCLNGADTIGTQLEALARQDWPEPWELIVADNGSTDGSQKIVEMYCKCLPYMRLIDASARRGPSYARNAGVQASRAELLAFCDDDDEVAPNWVSAMAAALARHDFVAGRLDAKKLNPPWVLTSRPCPQTDGLQNYTYPPFLPHAASCNLGIKRVIHQAIGGFDENMRQLEDTDYCWRVQLAGTDLHYEREALVHYRFPPTMRRLYRQADLWGEYNVLLYKKYRPFGMPPLSWQEGVMAWLKLMRSLPQLRRRVRHIRWVTQFAWRAGRIRGSIKHRVMAI